MHKLIRELRRREVFRTTGIYVGVVWILVEASSVLLPAFEAPEWILRTLIIIGIIGVPVTVILAWFFDITDQGIEIQADATDTVVMPFGSRRTDFVVIGILSVALIFSVYLHITGGPEVVEELEPVSILIADFDNKTGLDLFDGLLEQALNIGVESAPHITAYDRNGAQKVAAGLRPEITALDSVVALLVAVREGINMVLAGSIEPAGSGFDLKVTGLEPTDGRTLFEVRQTADSIESVLQVVGELSGEVREQLGDVLQPDSVSPVAETFSAKSIEAARAYIDGIELAYKGNHEEAVPRYQRAIELDPDFGRAYASLALSSSRVGMTGTSEDAWQKALSLMDTMTERERLRTLGVYYASVTRNFNSAIDNFAALVEKYPADAAGHNNLAVSYFYTLDFDNALSEGAMLLDIYPNSRLYRSNYALYAMYATSFDQAAAEARKVVAEDPAFYKGYLPQAIAALDARDFPAAMAAYESMKQGGTRGASLALVGLADAHIYSGEFDQALEVIRAGISADEAAGNARAVARKRIIEAEASLEQGKISAAADSAHLALGLDQGDAISVVAGMVFIAAGVYDSVDPIVERLSQQLQPQRRAYGAMLAALRELADGNTISAVDTLNSAVGISDLWLIRLQLGRAYLRAGYAAEAIAEFEAARSRRGEAAAVFLDDVPTFRYLAELPYWIALAQLELGMTDAARQNLSSFLELRPNGGKLVADARARLRGIG